VHKLAAIIGSGTTLPGRQPTRDRTPSGAPRWVVWTGPERPGVIVQEHPKAALVEFEVWTDAPDGRGAGVEHLGGRYRALSFETRWLPWVQLRPWRPPA
jgi:hypothetical protein